MKKLILCSMIAGILMLFAACGANETSQPVSPSPAASRHRLQNQLHRLPRHPLSRRQRQKNRLPQLRLLPQLLLPRLRDNYQNSIAFRLCCFFLDFIPFIRPRMLLAGWKNQMKILFHRTDIFPAV